MGAIAGNGIQRLRQSIRRARSLLQGTGDRLRIVEPVLAVLHKEVDDKTGIEEVHVLTADAEIKVTLDVHGGMGRKTARVLKAEENFLRVVFLHQLGDAILKLQDSRAIVGDGETANRSFLIVPGQTANRIGLVAYINSDKQGRGHGNHLLRLE
ncbi:hypothetical protein [Effusibacillus dendaii]|uniref:Uncharacterized protein n=1 Tax=Effusibacillus dendaii TaxID=2743772 RepID=A0A7I8DCZ7_9BACL|nr:hypothetical protein [Effusibacillus dendaii]BCJ88083.1 hypothetical protein skT53_30680 [Effusibacillus dendaii]